MIAKLRISTVPLAIVVGVCEVQLTPRQGLAFAERLARKSFLRGLQLEAADAMAHPAKLLPRKLPVQRTAKGKRA
jgi:hypothetical protein